MQTCSKCHTQNPDEAQECRNCHAVLAEWSETAVTLKRYLKNPRVKYVRVVVYHDCCPACRQVEGAFQKDQVPTLPVEGCSHQNGCRCFYQPFLTELYP